MSSILVDVKYEAGGEVTQQRSVKPLVSVAGVGYKVCIGETPDNQYILYGHVDRFDGAVGGVIGQSLSEAQEHVSYLLQHVGEAGSVTSITKTCSVKVTTESRGNRPVCFSSGENTGRTWQGGVNPTFYCNTVELWEDFLIKASDVINSLPSGGSKSGGDYDYAMGVV